MLSEEVVEHMPCAALELSVVFCCIEEVKLRLNFAYSFLPFLSEISAGFCISFICKAVSLSLHFLVRHDVKFAFICYLPIVWYFLLYIHLVRIYVGIYRAGVSLHT